MKKLLLALSLMLTAAVAATAADRAYVFFSVIGDESAELTVTPVKKKLRIEKAKLGKSFKGKQFRVCVPLDKEGKAEAEFTVTANAQNAKFRIGMFGWTVDPETKAKGNTWVTCNELEINGTKYIPAPKKPITCFKWRQINSMPCNGAETFNVRIGVVKPSAERVAQLEKNRKAQSAKRKAKKAAPTQD